jgi:anti-sigma factor RsiW
MSACRFSGMIDGYYDGELPTEDAREFEAHLRDCAECGHELARLKALSQAMAGIAIPDPSAEFSARLHKTVSTNRDFALIMLVRRLATAAAAVFVISLISYAMMANRTSTTAVGGSWETAMRTQLTNVSTDSVQDTAQWFVDQLSAENNHE